MKIKQFYDRIRSSASPSQMNATEKSDPFLIDPQAAVILIQKVEDRDTCEIRLNVKDASAIYERIDARTFLTGRIEGQLKRVDGEYHPVEIYYRDYQPPVAYGLTETFT